MKFEFSWKIFEKNSNIKFNVNMLSRSQVVACWRTDGREDRYDEANSRFRNFANTSKKV